MSYEKAIITQLITPEILATPEFEATFNKNDSMYLYIVGEDDKIIKRFDTHNININNLTE